MVVRNAFLEREGKDIDYEMSLPCPTLFFCCIEVDERLCHSFEIGIGVACAQSEFLLQIANGLWNAVGEVGFLLPKTTIAVGTLHLKDAEKDEEVETVFEGIWGKGQGAS